MISAMNIALSGMLAETTRLSATASNVANAHTPDYQPLRVEQQATEGGGTVATVRPLVVTGVDMAEQMTDLVQATHGFAANMAVFETASDMMRTLYDLGED